MKSSSCSSNRSWSSIAAVEVSRQLRSAIRVTASAMVVSGPGLSTRVRRAILTMLLLWGLGASPAARADDSPGGGPVSEPPYAPGHVLVHYRGTPGERTLRLPVGASVPEAVQKLRADPRVGHANPDFLVRAADVCMGPNDPGHSGCWEGDQWNFLSPTSVPGGGGVDALGAWHNVNVNSRRHITVAVLDTGVAFRNKGRRFRRDPDLPARRRFVDPKDFVAHDRVPLD